MPLLSRYRIFGSILALGALAAPFGLIWLCSTIFITGYFAFDPIGAGLQISTFFVLFTVYEVGLGLGSATCFRAARTLIAAAHGDDRHTPRLLVQPDPALALLSGETLEARHPVGMRAMLPVMLVVVAGGLFLASVFELLIIIAWAPHLNLWLDQYLFHESYDTYGPAPLLSDVPSAEWLLMAGSSILFVAIIVWLWLAMLGYVRRIYTADDYGLTRYLLFGRKRFIARHEIEAFLVRMPPHISERKMARGPSYIVMGNRRAMMWQEANHPHAHWTQAAQMEKWATYIAALRRINATIVARSVPARYASLTWAERFAKIAVPLGDLTPDRLANWPDAPQQPNREVGEIASAGSARKQQLVAAISPWRVVPLAFMCSVGYLVFLTMQMRIEPDDWAVVVQSRGSLLLCGVLLAVALVTGFSFVHGRYTAYTPTVTAQADKLIVYGVESQTILWRDMRGWLMVRPSPVLSNATTYVILTENQQVIWTEPDDAQAPGRGSARERQERYRQQAAALHAIIAARTRLPLKIVPQEVGAMVGATLPKTQSAPSW